MYKLIIADDEIDFRGRIIKIIETSNIGFDLVGNFDNGLDALEGVVNSMPDVLITDIKMPFMDGITLIKNIRKDFPLLKIIIISGFDEFDYAKEAIDLGVTSFITKPITLECIKEVLLKVKEELDIDLENKEKLQELLTFKEENTKQILSSEFNHLISNSYNKNHVVTKLSKFNIKLDYSKIVCCYVDLDEANHEYNTSILIDDILNATLIDYDINTFTRGYANIILIKSNNEINVNDLSYKLNECIMRISKYMNKKVSIGVSLNTNSYSIAFTQAKKAIESRAILKGEQVFIYNQDDGVNLSFEEDIQLIKTLLINNNIEEVTIKLDEVKKLIVNSKISLNNYNYLVTKILNNILSRCQRIDLVYVKYENVLVEVLSCKTVDDTFHLLNNIVILVNEINKKIIVNQMDVKLNQILNYIENNYKENIVLDDLANKMDLTSNYICSLLKKHKNTTFVKYLTKVRMEKAVELLRTKQYKIVDVSLLIGYEDPFYFSHCFKKYIGKSPKEFLNTL